MAKKGDICPICGKGVLMVHDHSMYKGSKCEHMIQMASDDKNRKSSPYKWEDEEEEETLEEWPYENNEDDDENNPY